MKKIKLVACAICCAVLLTACGYTEPTALSEPTSTESSSSSSSTTEESTSSSTTVAEPVPEPKVETLCTAYALYCVEDGEMLDSYKADMRIAPASLTKILTASVVLRYLDPDEVLTVGTELELVHKNSSLCMIEEGERITVGDLLYGLLLPSGNDAAYTFAVSTARKVSGNFRMSDKQATEYFCRLMNEMALELDMRDSRFADPDGWDAPNHYTTVNDLITLSEYALTVPEIREAVATPIKEVMFETGEHAMWYNANALLFERSEYYNENAIGMKNGATDDAGYCLIAAFEKNGKTYIDIVVGSETIEDRYEKILQLYDQIP